MGGGGWAPLPSIAPQQDLFPSPADFPARSAERCLPGGRGLPARTRQLRGLPPRGEGATHYLPFFIL